MQNETIEFSTMSKGVYDSLRDQIRKGILKPGQKLTIRQIAESFGVSTMPVREALSKLQAEGFVIFDRRSTLVRNLSLQEVKEIFSIRQRLETLAIEWALPNLKQEDLIELKEILKQMDRQNISHDDWERLNHEFHLKFYKLSKSETLIQLIKNVWDSVTPYMHIFLSSVDSLHHAQNEHHEMIKMIEDNNLDGLIALTTNHLEYTSSVITNALEGL